MYSKADLIVKVKEPQPQEFTLLRPGQVVFTYFHFAASRELTQAAIESGIVAIAYETIRTDDGQHPMLTPMSEVAGRMAIQEGAKNFGDQIVNDSGLKNARQQAKKGPLNLDILRSGDAHKANQK